MSKAKPTKPRADIRSLAIQTKPDPNQSFSRTSRETIESIVIAFVLAFLFRTFEAEAFVIPTGSMAPTLQGRHKDLACANCGYRVRASASDEDSAIEQIARADVTNPTQAQLNAQAQTQRNAQVVAVTCPLCRFETSVDPEEHGDEFPSQNGDRIIVAKFPYDFVEPRRWDIVVFKFPNDAKINYIKRLVGLPGETIRILHGNLYSKPKDGKEFQIERKPPEKQLAMAQIVYDNNYLVPAMTDLGWPQRWQPWPVEKASQAAEWISGEDGKSFEIESDKSIKPAWLRYQHFPPTDRQWQLMEAGESIDTREIKPQLITDFYAYNGRILRNSRRAMTSNGMHWVGDLMLEANVDVRGDKGNLLLDLVEGGVHFRATIDVATGEAVLSIDGQSDFKPKATTPIKGQGDYRLNFANFDDQLTLWVNGSVVQFDVPTTYGPLDNIVPQSTSEDAGDLAPVGIGVEGGLAAKVRDLVVKRDIYYIADKYGDRANEALSDYQSSARILSMNSDEQMAEFFSDPVAWKTPDSQGRTPFEARKEILFPLAEDQFFVMGDNSPASADSRLWPGQHFVEREMMIGKALFIYWPHGLYHIPGTGIPFPMGMFPNFSDMGFVR